MITPEQINRINELARKSKTQKLSDEEKEEQAALRRLYIDGFRQSLIGQLENTYVVDEQGNKRKIKRKNEKTDNN